jgi:hypothetical protein
MPEVPITQSDLESLAQKLGSANPPASRVSGHRTPPLAVGLAALLLAGPIAASVVAAAAQDSLPSLRAQFANAFTPGTINAMPECCSVKLPPRTDGGVGDAEA